MSYTTYHLSNGGRLVVGITPEKLERARNWGDIKGDMSCLEIKYYAPWDDEFPSDRGMFYYSPEDYTRDNFEDITDEFNMPEFFLSGVWDEAIDHLFPAE